MPAYKKNTSRSVSNPPSKEVENGVAKSYLSETVSKMWETHGTHETLEELNRRVGAFGDEESATDEGW